MLDLASPAFLCVFLPLSALCALLPVRGRARTLIYLALSLGFCCLSLRRNAGSVAGAFLLLLPAAFLCRVGRRGNMLYAGLCLAALVLSRLPLPDWARPEGLSYMALQGLMLAHYYLRGGRDMGPGEGLLCVVWYPRLLSGPLQTPKDFAEALRGRPEWSVDALSRVAVGLFKKAVLAERLRPLALCGFAEGAGPAEALLTLLCAMLYVYYDFSGWCDMGVGVSRLMGVRLPENFDAPMRAVSLSDFWRRWHRTLSRFFRDYVYIPLGGSRRGRAVTARSLAAVFLLSALFHGGAMPYVLFFAFHGALVIAERLIKARPDGRRIAPGRRPAPGRACTLIICFCSFTLFLAPDVPAFCAFVRAFFAGGAPMVSTLAALDPVTCACVALAPVLFFLEPRLKTPPFLLPVLLAAGFLAALGGGYAPFLYAGF